MLTMNKCPKCDGELVKLPEKEIGFFGSIGIYFAMEIGFWILVVFVFSFGSIGFDAAFMISLIIVFVSTHMQRV